jgi:transcription initiation factor TFIIF subunit beta
MDDVNRAALRADREIDIIDDDEIMRHLGNLRQTGGFEGFVRGVGDRKKHTQDNKAARIPERDLIDILYGLFKQWKYWKLKDLRAATKQPEAYLKQVLSTIAVLITSGSFSGTWTLPADPSSDLAEADVKEEVAPDQGATDIESEDMGDDGDDDLEDVVVG